MLKEGVKYMGGVIDDQPNDKGKVVWDDGTCLLGTFFFGQLA